jgi:hypothetical protein
MKCITTVLLLFLSLTSAHSQEKNYQLAINSKIMGDDVLKFGTSISIEKSGRINWETEAGYMSASLSASIIGFDHQGDDMTVNFKYNPDDFTESAGSLKVNFNNNRLIFKPPVLYGMDQPSGVYTFETIYLPGNPIILDGEFILSKASTEGMAFNSGTVFTFENNVMSWEAIINNIRQQFSVRFVEVNTKDSVSVGKTIWGETEGSFIMGTDNIIYKIDSKSIGLVRLDFIPTQKEIEKRKKREQERKIKQDSDNKTLAKIEESILQKNALLEAAELFSTLHFSYPNIETKMRQALIDFYATQKNELSENEFSNFISSVRNQLKTLSLKEGNYLLFIDTLGNGSIVTSAGKKGIQSDIIKTIKIGRFNIPVNVTDTLRIEKNYENIENPEIVVHVNSTKPVGQKKNGALYLSGFFTKGFFDPIVISSTDQSIEKGRYAIMETRNEITWVNSRHIINSEKKKVITQSGKLHKRIPKVLMRSAGLLICAGIAILISGLQ